MTVRRIATDDEGKVLYSMPASVELGSSTADVMNYFTELSDVLLKAATGSCPRQGLG